MSCVHTLLFDSVSAVDTKALCDRIVPNVDEMKQHSEETLEMHTAVADVPRSAFYSLSLTFRADCLMKDRPAMLLSGDDILVC